MAPVLLQCLSLLLIAIPGEAAPKTFDFNTNCRNAYAEIIQLKLTAGQALLEEEKKIHPDNLIPYFLENYIDFFILFFNEDPAEYKKRWEHEDIRLELMQQGPQNSPYYLFTRSEIHFQWAAIQVKFGNNWQAGWEFRRAYLQSKENGVKYPSFSPSSMLHGVMQVAVGTIPDGYRWLSNLLGMKGNIHAGIKEMETFLSTQDELSGIFYNEAVFYYLYLKFYIENKKNEVFEFIAKNKLDIKNNLLFTYLASNLAINNQQSKYAEQVLASKNNSPEYFSSAVWDLEYGYARLNHLEKDANLYLERFIKNFNGKFYVKDVLLKLAWYYYLQNDMQKANAYRALVIERGAANAESDKQALKDAKSGAWPNKILLQARLLNDGGYHTEALNLLLGKSSSDFETENDRLEFAYRLARIYDDLGRREDALEAYLTTIKTGENSHEYYAARAALQAGYLYEKTGEKEKAIGYFQKCLSLKDHEYKNSLDQRAKAGIARCTGK